MVCPGYCEVVLGSDFKVTVLSELVMEEGELVADVVDPVEALPLVMFLGFLFLVWMLSFFMARGRGTPWSFMYKPQALQTGSPSAFLLHRVVLVVWQFVQHRPARLEEDSLFCGLRGRLMPFILW